MGTLGADTVGGCVCLSSSKHIWSQLVRHVDIDKLTHAYKPDDDACIAHLVGTYHIGMASTTRGGNLTCRFSWIQIRSADLRTTITRGAMRCRWAIKAVAGFGLLVGGCNVDEPAQPSKPGVETRVDGRGGHVDPPGAIPTFPDLVDFIPSVVATEGLPPALPDQELVAAVAATNGSVFIALKPRSAQRTRETGRTPGISKVAYQEGRTELERLGVQVVRTYRSLPFFEARIAPETAPSLRRLDFVDDVGPAGYDVIASGEGVGTASLMFSETQDWGLQKVRADLVWAAEGNYGDSARVTVLDTGIDSTHYHVWPATAPDTGHLHVTTSI